MPRFEFSYPLVDEILIIILGAEFPLHLLNLGALQEYLAFHGKHLFPGQLALAHKGNQLTSILQLFPKAPQLISTLGVPPAGLPNLADLASTEANIGIGVVGILTGFKLRLSACAHALLAMRLTLRLGSSDRFPVLVLMDFQWS